MKCALFLCCLGFFFLPCQSANIAVYMPLPFYSHQTSFKPLWLELAKRGHKIILIQCNVIVENNENITHILLNETYAKMNKAEVFDNLAKGESIIRILLTALEGMSDTLEYQLTHPDVQNLLNGDQKVDLLFAEYLSAHGFALGSKLNVPMIGVVSMDTTIGSHMVMGNPTHPVMYPDKDLSVSTVLTFQDRLISCLYWMGFYLAAEVVLYPMQNTVVRRALGDVPPLEEIWKNISLLFINANPLFNVERPLTPSTINIGGGLHLLEPRPLPKELQDYLDEAENGVIYFSLGSSITSEQMPSSTKKVILETFAQLPYKILWKFEEEPDEISENVKIVKWVPQQDLLRHKNIKLFITQGGLQSMEESIFNYVPMVALPFYGDQLSNANKMMDKGFGLMLDHNSMTTDTFKNVILEVINDPRYRERTRQLADLVLDQPMTGLQKGVWWTEYVLRHGHTNIFRNPSIDIPWYQYFLLDVISFIIVVIVILTYFFTKSVQILWRTLRKLWSVCKKNKKTKTN